MNVCGVKTCVHHSPLTLPLVEVVLTLLGGSSNSFVSVLYAWKQMYSHTRCFCFVFVFFSPIEYVLETLNAK